MFNDLINGRSDSMCRLIPSVNDLKSNGKQPRLDDRRDISTTADDVKILTKGLQELT